MPGIVVNTSVRTGPTAVNQNPTATVFMVGRSQRGPEGTAKLVGSLADYEAIYGDYIASGALHQQVQTFFEEGGAQVYVSRVVGASSTFGELDVTGGSAGTAMTLTAAGQGAWSSNLDAEVVALGSGFNVKLFLDDALVYSTGEVANVAAAVSKINASTVAANYATAEAGADTLAVFAKAAFSAGDADESSITDSDYVVGLGEFTDDLGTGAVCIPNDGNFSDISTIHEALVAHAAANNRFALLSGEQDDSSSDIITRAEAVTAGDDAEYAAMFFPYVKMVNESGTTLTLSPEGYVAAKRAAAHNSIGSWAAYAGLVSESKFVTGLSSSINAETGNDLDDNKVNALRLINGRVRVYGARTLSSDEDNFRFTTSREMLNYVVDRSKAVLEDLIFSPIDGRSSLFSKVEARLVNMLEPIRIAGGLYEAFDTTGRRIDYGYSVQVNDAINPLSQLAGGLVKAKVGIRVSSTSDQIQVDVTKSNLTASVV
jgi:hypothetical protein